MFAFNVEKLYIHKTGMKKLKEWLQGEAGDLSVSYIIFSIYLVREIIIIFVMEGKVREF